jgi:hypothetical protein
VALVELYPAALKYDPSPDNRYTFPFLFIGMGIMALSIVLFEL